MCVGAEWLTLAGMHVLLDKGFLSPGLKVEGFMELMAFTLHYMAFVALSTYSEMS